jgi:sugar/nucleoside kinase (ribokinase family)
MALDKPVVCLGILVADLVGRPLRAVPDPGRLVLVDEMALHTGGCALNAAVGLARLGLPVEVIGKVGADPLGDFLLQTMAGLHIGTRGVSRDPQTGTSATMVMVEPDGERRFVHYIGANARLWPEDVDLALVAEASILHVAGALVLPGLDGQPMAALLETARSEGVITCLDTVWDDTGQWMDLLGPSLRHVDYFVPSLGEAQALTGLDDPEQVACALLERGVGTVVLKMGSAGCLVAPAKGERLRLSAYDVPVIDTTGAGDAFAAGFIAGVWLGWSLERAARLANAAGALCVTAAGACGKVSSLPEIVAFMDSARVKS